MVSFFELYVSFDVTSRFKVGSVFNGGLWVLPHSIHLCRMIRERPQLALRLYDALEEDMHESIRRYLQPIDETELVSRHPPKPPVSFSSLLHPDALLVGLAKF